MSDFGYYPPEPKERGDNFIGRWLTNCELQQNLRRSTLESDIAAQNLRTMNSQKEMLMLRVTTKPAIQAQLEHYKTLETLAQVEAEKALIGIKELRMDHKIKALTLEEKLKELPE